MKKGIKAEGGAELRVWEQWYHFQGREEWWEDGAVYILPSQKWCQKMMDQDPEVQTHNVTIRNDGGEGGGRGDRDGEDMWTQGLFISMYDKIHYK